MEFDNSALECIKRMGASFFPPAEIAEVLEVDEVEFIALFKTPGSEVRKAYRSGFLSRQLELRERIFLDAKNGSSPAQTLAMKLMEQVIVKNFL